MIDDDRQSLEKKLKDVRAALSGLQPAPLSTSVVPDPLISGSIPVDPLMAETTSDDKEALREQLEAEERDLEESLRAAS